MSTELSVTVPADNEVASRLPAGDFRHACRQLGVFGCVEQAILVSDGNMVVGEWGANLRRAKLAAEHVRQTCDPSSQAIQIQYACLDGDRDGRLIYVKPVSDYLLTLVAREDTGLSRLRRVADSLAKMLGGDVGSLEQRSQEPFSGRPALPDHSVSLQRTDDHVAYAIAWRPVEPLPRAIRKIIRESVQRLARREGCQLSFIGVASDHVHLVLQCPSRRNGSWAAYAFKRGIEEDIANRFGTSASLWQKGFLADPSADPLGGEELLAYLNH